MGSIGTIHYQSLKNCKSESVKDRAKVEYVFGRQYMMMEGKLMRCIGIVRAKAQIGLRNLVHNMSRFVFWETKRALA